MIYSFLCFTDSPSFPVLIDCTILPLCLDRCWSASDVHSASHKRYTFLKDLEECIDFAWQDPVLRLAFSPFSLNYLLDDA